MNPSIDTGPDSPQMTGKSAKYEMMNAVYIRALRRQAIRRHGTPAATQATAASTPTPDSPAPAPAPAPAAMPAPAAA
eukprot:7381146-Prymnesium_polylepis.1